MTNVGQVNIKFGDNISKLLYEAAKQTYGNRPGAVAELHSSFSGLRAIHPGYKPDGCYELLGSDGIGTKVEIAERIGDYSTIAHDLFAMVCDDAVVRGSEPIAINTVLDVNVLKDNDEATLKALQQIATGYAQAARLAKVVILSGELAELGNRVKGYGTFNYNWCATLLSYAHKDRVLAGNKIKPGDALIGLGEDGFRSNGLTDARRVLNEKFGPHWHKKVVSKLDTVPLGQLVAKPSIIYSRFITELTGGCDITKQPLAEVSGVAHITGGGIPSKLGRMLEPSGLGANLTAPQTPPMIMRFVQDLDGLSDKQAYGKWHMGSGMIISTSDPQAVLDHAEKRSFKAQVIGEVTKEPGIRIVSRGVQNPGELLAF